MANAFQVVGQQRTVLVRSPSSVEDVMEIHAVTKPSGVGFVRDVLYTTWKAKGVGPLLQPIAEHIEHIMDVRPVVSAAPVQTVDANGLITNAVEFVVHARDTAGDRAQAMTSTVVIPVQALHDQADFASYFVPVLDALDAAAKL